MAWPKDLSNQLNEYWSPWSLGRNRISTNQAQKSYNFWNQRNKKTLESSVFYFLFFKEVLIFEYCSFLYSPKVWLLPRLMSHDSFYRRNFGFKAMVNLGLDFRGKKIIINIYTCLCTPGNLIVEIHKLQDFVKSLCFSNMSFYLFKISILS